MLTLAIDTATKVCAVGLCRDGQILAEYRINMGMTHSEGLMPQLEQLLTRTKITKNEIDLLAVSMGPGSFTGIRLVLTTAAALRRVGQARLAGLDNMQALATSAVLQHNLFYGTPVWVITHARRNLELLESLGEKRLQNLHYSFFHSRPVWRA